MPRIPGRTSQAVPHAASKLTEFTSSLQPAVPPAPPARRPHSGGTPAGRLAAHAEGDAGASRRAAYAACGWVLTFVAWHVVWAVTGLPFPHDHWSGAAQILYWGFDAVIWGIWAIGIAVPLALARPWGRRVPRWMLLWAAWTGCALLGARGIVGVIDDVVRAIGFSGGLTGMTTAQVMGTGHPSAWLSFASTATDVLFAAGGLMFGLAALTYQRAFPRRRSAEPVGLRGLSVRRLQPRVTNLGLAGSDLITALPVLLGTSTRTRAPHAVRDQLPVTLTDGEGNE